MSDIYPRPEINRPRMVFHETDQDNLDESLYVPEMSISEVVKRLPKSRIWTWQTEPSARAGDMFVFRYGRVRNIDNHIVEFPDVYIQLDRNPVRHPSSRYWWAPFTLHGLDRGEYMAPGGAKSPGGSTSVPRLSIDPEVPLDPAPIKNRELEEMEERVRVAKRYMVRKNAEHRRDRRPWKRAA